LRGYIEQNFYMRECCYACQYKTFPRVADITLADFWGIGASDEMLDPDKGTSLIMINSEKGNELFSAIESKIFYQQSTLEIALKGNRCIVASAEKNPKSGEFLKMLDTLSFDKCFNKCVGNNIYSYIKFIIFTFFRRTPYLMKIVRCIRSN